MTRFDDLVIFRHICLDDRQPLPQTGASNLKIVQVDSSRDSTSYASLLSGKVVPKLNMARVAQIKF